MSDVMPAVSVASLALLQRGPGGQGTRARPVEGGDGRREGDCGAARTRQRGADLVKGCDGMANCKALGRA